MAVFYESYYGVLPLTNDVVKHHGIHGMHWGKRRFQHEDGSLTPEGRERYGVGHAHNKARTDHNSRTHGHDYSNKDMNRMRKQLTTETVSGLLKIPGDKEVRRALDKERRAEERAERKTERAEKKIQDIIDSGDMKKITKNAKKLTQEQLEKAMSKADLVESAKRSMRDQAQIDADERTAARAQREEENIARRERRARLLEIGLKNADLLAQRGVGISGFINQWKRDRSLRQLESKKLEKEMSDLQVDMDKRKADFEYEKQKRMDDRADKLNERDYQRQERLLDRLDKRNKDADDRQERADQRALDKWKKVQDLIEARQKRIDERDDRRDQFREELKDKRQKYKDEQDEKMRNWKAARIDKFDERDERRQKYKDDVDDRRQKYADEKSERDRKYNDDRDDKLNERNYQRDQADKDRFERNEQAKFDRSEKRAERLDKRRSDRNESKDLKDAISDMRKTASDATKAKAKAEYNRVYSQTNGTPEQKADAAYEAMEKIYAGAYASNKRRR